MRARALVPAGLALTLLLAALSTGSPVLLMPAALLLLGLFSGGISVLTASRTLRISGELDVSSVQRGEEARLDLRISHRGLLPVAPILLEISFGPEGPAREVRLRDRPGRLQTLVLPFRAEHVGVWKPGVRTWRVEDLLGFFSASGRAEEALPPLLVLPRTFPTEPLRLSPGDPGSELLSRATEDLSAPSDIRAWQPGDPLKKVHWKLSLRKRELLVRKFDEPILQEVLLLMDCSRPPSWGRPEAEADVRDALLETAASVFADQQGTDLKVHFPLFGTHPVELEKGMPLAMALENLARTDFSETDRFERVLALESRRLRKVGCLVVISARLNSAMVDLMTRMRGLGPAMRLYLVTFTPDDPRLLPLISRLQQQDIEVSYVRPEVRK